MMKKKSWRCHFFIDKNMTLFYNAAMPVKIRELEAMLLKAGFICRPGKGSHRKYYHDGTNPVIMSGKRRGQVPS